MKGALSRFHIALMLVASGALLFSFFIYLLYTANLLGFPYDYDQGEGFEVYDTVLFSRGELPYRDTEVYPFYSSNYPPLFHVMAAPFVWFFGPAHWYGRLLGFLGSLVSAGAIAYAVYRDGGGHRWIAALSGLAFLSSNFVYHIGPLYRQHTMMVTIETLAIVMLASAFPGRDRRGRWGGLAPVDLRRLYETACRHQRRGRAGLDVPAGAGAGDTLVAGISPASGSPCFSG